MPPRGRALQKISTNVPVTPRREVTALKAQIEKNDVEMKQLKSQLAELTASNKDMTQKHSAEMAELSATLSKTNIEQVSTASVPAYTANPFGGALPKVTKVAPKRPLGAYHHFAQVFRSEAKKECDGGSLAEVNSVLHKMWASASDETKKPYEEKAAEDKNRYSLEMDEFQREMDKVENERVALEAYFLEKKQQEMETFYNEHYADFAAKSKKAEAAAQTKIEPPKQARTAYNFYSKIRREQIQSGDEKLPFEEVTKQIGAEWTDIQKSRKKADKAFLKKCRVMAEEDRERYAEEQEKWEQARTEQAAKEAAELEVVKQEALKRHAEKMGKETEIKQLMAQKKEADKLAKVEKKKAREEKKSEKEAKALLPKRPRSAYIFFSMDNRSAIAQKMPGANLGEISRKIGTEWRALDAEGREPFEESARKDKARYEEEMKLCAQAK